MLESSKYRSLQCNSFLKQKGELCHNMLCCSPISACAMSQDEKDCKDLCISLRNGMKNPTKIKHVHKKLTGGNAQSVLKHFAAC